MSWRGAGVAEDGLCGLAVADGDVHSKTRSKSREWSKHRMFNRAVQSPRGCCAHFRRDVYCWVTCDLGHPSLRYGIQAGGLSPDAAAQRVSVVKPRRVGGAVRLVAMLRASATSRPRQRPRESGRGVVGHQEEQRRLDACLDGRHSAESRRVVECKFMPSKVLM